MSHPFISHPSGRGNAMMRLCVLLILAAAIVPAARSAKGAEEANAGGDAVGGDDAGATDAGATEEVAAAISSFGSDDIAARLAAVDALAKAGAPAVPPLAAALEMGDAMTRVYACRALARIPGADSKAAILKALLPPAGPAMRAVACEALVSHADTDSVDALRKAASDDPSLYVRKTATLALAAIRTREAVDILVWLLKNSENNIRQSAAERLRAITMQDFGLSYEAWQKWWLDNKADFPFTRISKPNKQETSNEEATQPARP